MMSGKATRAGLSCGLFAIAMGVAACAGGAPPPTGEVAVANARIGDAERNGAVQYAPVELNDARTKLAQAEAAMRDHNYEHATRLAGEAEADARLADVKARAAAQQKAAGTVQQDMQTLGRQDQTPSMR